MDYAKSYGEAGVDHNPEQENQPLVDDTSKPANAPPDKYKFVFLIFGFLGLASLLPWNFFTTAKMYFDYKFRNTSLPSNVSFDDKAHTTTTQKEFESYLSIVSNVSNLIFMIITLLLVRSVSVKARIVGSTMLMTLIFIITATLVEVNTDSWQQIFFIVTLVMAALMSGVQSVLTGSIFGLSALFPALYSQSAMIGQAAGGTFSAVVNILTHMAGGSVISSAFIYFSTATLVTLLALLSYLTLHYMKFSRLYMTTHSTSLQNTWDNDVRYHDVRKDYFIEIFKKTWLYCASLCLIFLVTLAVFPAVCALIRPVNTDKDNEWKNTYFTPVICFLLFNTGDFVGRLSTFICKFPGPHRPKLILFLCILRIAFIPLIMYCNAQPRLSLHLVFHDDAYPVAFILLMGLSNGYLSTLCMAFGPMNVPVEHAEGTGMMLALAMSIGLAAGSSFSYLCVKLL